MTGQAASSACALAAAVPATAVETGRLHASNRLCDCAELFIARAAAAARRTLLFPMHRP